MSPTPTPTGSRVEIKLVPFLHGECPSDHPDLQALLQTGWAIRRTDLRLVEGGQLKHLVVLHRSSVGAAPLSQQPLPRPSSTVPGGATALAS